MSVTRFHHHNRRRRHNHRPVMPMPITNGDANRKSRVCLHLTQPCEHHYRDRWNKELFHTIALAF
jgi:hypothetical protein